MHRVFGHTGDLGDILASLPSVRALGGGHYCVGHKKGKNFGRESMKGARFDAILPLLEEQGYIFGVKWIGSKWTEVNHDFSTFRRGWKPGDNLAQKQAAHLGVKISEEPWLTATPNEQYRGITVMARSLRYHEPLFPWRKLRAEHRKSIFVGMPDEHADFERRFGTIEYVPTKDLLELAEIIAAAKLTISNQTATWWIAAGLGVAVTQETYSGSRDSVIQRPNAKYFYRHQPVTHRASIRV